jgi:hypothetical protein
MEKHGNKARGLPSKTDMSPGGGKRTIITDLLAAFQSGNATELSPETLQAVFHYATQMQVRMGALSTLTSAVEGVAGQGERIVDKSDPWQSLVEAGDRCATAVQPLGSGLHSVQDFIACLELLAEVECNMDAMEDVIASHLHGLPLKGVLPWH